MTTIYGNVIFLKFQTYLIGLLTGDLFFKCVFAHGIVSLVFSLLSISLLSKICYSPKKSNYVGIN